jgi:hypothetical protein
MEASLMGSGQMVAARLQQCTLGLRSPLSVWCAASCISMPMSKRRRIIMTSFPADLVDFRADQTRGTPREGQLMRTLCLSMRQSTEQYQ